MNVDNKRLGDIATYINGYAFKPEQWDTNGKPIIRIQNLNNNLAEFNYYNGDINEKYIVNKGDILISWSASIGVYEWQNEEALLNQHIFKVDFNKININKQYFKYVVGIALERAMQFMHGSTMKHITKKYFDDIIIPIPSLSVQYEVVDVLNKSQQLIDKRKEQIEALDELVKSQFIEMFGDPFRNPKAWKIKYYEEICNCITDGEHSTPRRCDEGIYLLSARNVLNHSLQLNDVDYIDEEEYKRIAKRIIPEENDILVSCSGSVGRVCKVPKDMKFQMVRSVAILKLNEDINATFMEWLIDSNYTQKQILQSVNQSSQANLFQGKIRKLKAIVPPIELQNNFENFVKQIDKLKFEMENSLKELENNFNSLMQRAFKGELFN